MEGEREKLLPCPFCGSEMIVRQHSAFHPQHPECHLAHDAAFELSEWDYPSWNRRPAPVPPAGESGKTHELWIAVDEHGAPDLATLHVDESGCLHTMDEIGLMGFEPRRCTLSILEQAAPPWREKTMANHELVDGTFKIEDYEGGKGVIGRCTCGWTTGYRISPAAASVAFRDHQEEPAKDPPNV